jgi:hypothetical protein
LLVSAALFALERVPGLPVDEEVKSIMGRRGGLFRSSTRCTDVVFAMDGIRFREMARIATLRRFPADQFHWEASGLPRSFLPRTSLRESPRLQGMPVHRYS